MSWGGGLLRFLLATLRKDFNNRCGLRGEGREGTRRLTIILRLGVRGEDIHVVPGFSCSSGTTRLLADPRSMTSSRWALSGSAGGGRNQIKEDIYGSFAGGSRMCQSYEQLEATLAYGFAQKTRSFSSRSIPPGKVDQEVETSTLLVGQKTLTMMALDRRLHALAPLRCRLILTVVVPD